MKQLLHLWALALSITLAAGCTQRAATEPTPPQIEPTPPQTRIIRLGGDLIFGNISLRDTFPKEAVMTVSNDGNDSLQVTGMSGPCVGRITVPGPTSFTVTPGGTVPVTFRFSGGALIDCTGTVTVSGNQTSGTNTIPILARAVQPGCEVVPPQDELPPGCLGR